MDVGLPVRPVVNAFERGVQVARIAAGFGCDPRDVIDCITQFYLEQGLSREGIAERFGQHWGV